MSSVRLVAGGVAGAQRKQEDSILTEPLETMAVEMGTPSVVASAAFDRNLTAGSNPVAPTDFSPIGLRPWLG